MGKPLNCRQEDLEDTLNRAKAECEFTERLYKILLDYQNGEKIRGRHPEGIPKGKIGELDEEMSRLYNLIWASAVGLNEKARSKPKQKQMEVIA